MTISPVNGIYEQYQSGKITLEKATNLLLEELYKSSYYFGISKKNLKVFKVMISRDDKIYKQGKEKYEELAFRWWMLFG